MNDKVINEYRDYLLKCFTANMNYKRGEHYMNAQLSLFHNGYAKLTNMSAPRLLYMDKLGKVRIVLDYPYGGDFYEELAKVRNEYGLYGFINKNGQIVIPFKYTNVGVFHGGLAKVELNGLWGYVNNKGEEVISITYKKADDFSEGLAVVSNGNNNQIIDVNGNVIKDGITYTVYPFKCGYARCLENSGYFFIDKAGNKVGETYLEAEDFSSNLAYVKTVEGGFFIDTTFTKKFGSLNAKHYSSGIAISKEMAGFSLLDINGKFITQINALNVRDFKEGFSAVERSSFVWSYINTQGKLINNFGYNYASDFSEGLAIVRNSNNSPFYYINYLGEEIIFNYYSGDFDTSDILVPFRNTKNKYGYKDINGNTIIKPIYDMAYEYVNGIALVKVGTGTKYIDEQGKIIPNNKVGMLNNESIRYKKKLFGGYQYLNNRKELVSIKYMPIHEYDKYVLCYSSSNLYLFDKVNNTYQEISEIYNGNIKVELGLNYFVYNDMLYYLYGDEYVVINTHIFNFDRSKIIRLELLEGVTHIMSFDEFTKR